MEMAVNRTFSVTMFISILQLLNIMSVLSLAMSWIWICICILAASNSIIFLGRNRYGNIVKEYNNRRPSLFVKSIVVGYILMTIVCFALTR
jgi:hypothetical protein